MDIIFKVLRYLKKYSNLIKSVVFIVLFVLCIIQSVQINNYKSSYEEELNKGSVIETELDSIKQQNNELQTKLTEKEKAIDELNVENVQLEKTLHSLTTARNNTFRADGNYDQATEVWNYLRDLGLNPYVCAGIIGNIMAEVGGQTLDISRWPVYSQGVYYGICQWSNGRKQRLLNDFGTTLEDQIRFLSVELFEVIPKDNSFYNMQDEKEAALYFAKYYERCNSKYYSVRQKNATKALEYFMQ
jgi:hypothetical protein